MRVAMYYNNHDIRLEEMPIPEIGAGEILVRIMASGICGSDVLEWYRIKKAPLVLGHEIAGEIARTGKDVTKFRTGDRVFVNHHVPCNTCWYCLNGKHTVCETLHTTKFYPGGFAEFIRVPAINVDRGTFILTENISFEEGSFIEPLACVLRGQRVAGLKPEQTILILGSGISGLLHLICAHAAGAGRVIMTDISGFKLDMAKKLGAFAVVDARENVPEKVRELNKGRNADLVIVCTGAYPAFIQAIESVDRGGTILCFATTDPDITLPLPINQFWRNGITVLPSYANSGYDAAAAIHMLEHKILNVTPMITHRFALAQTGEGFRLMTDSKESYFNKSDTKESNFNKSDTGGSMKIIIEPQR